MLRSIKIVTFELHVRVATIARCQIPLDELLEAVNEERTVCTVLLMDMLWNLSIFHKILKSSTILTQRTLS